MSYLNTYQQQVIEYGGGGGGGGITSTDTIVVSGNPTQLEFDLPANCAILEFIGVLVAPSGLPFKIQFGTDVSWFTPALPFDIFGGLGGQPFLNTTVTTPDYLTYFQNYNTITLSSLATKFRLFVSNTDIPDSPFTSSNFKIVFTNP